MTIEIKAVKRDAKGTGASRRLRHAGSVPGVVYGAGKEAVTIELNAKELFLEFRHEAFHASVLDLILDGKKESVLLRDFQMHPVRNSIQHVDFQRVSATEKIHVKVPFHFINADIAPGVKIGGGIVAHIFTEADVSCLAKDLPEFIEVDVAKLEMGHAIHFSEIALPKGVSFVQLAHGADAAVVSIAKTRGSVSEATAEVAEAAAPAATPAADA
ncbi:MAG: 50S ribosomal protein L25/general stress protein Ctc [Methylotenera sp.]|nr:50S ribosomal protein L25/general stress protein Ctc [Methylotenera sp.]